MLDMNLDAYLGIMCVHEGFSEMEEDEVDVRHETVSGYGLGINLEQMSDRVIDCVMEITIPANPPS
jgi:hypothetical protein